MDNFINICQQRRAQDEKSKYVKVWIFEIILIFIFKYTI